MHGRALRAGDLRMRVAIAAAMATIAVLVGPVRPASGAWAHVVQPGESLWSVASANGLTAESVAAYNGLASDALLIAGETIQVPSAGETPSASSSAATSASHVVQPGESLWSVASANGLTTEALAAHNGLAADALLIIGDTIEVPGATSASTTSAPAVDPATGLAYVWSPNGSVPLDPGAAASFEAMRQASLVQFGVDLYPAGTLSGYRSYDQQAYLYDLFLSGQGAPANPPGSSSHEYGAAVDLAEPVMRDIVDQIGAGYGWAATIPSEWWHIAYVG